MKYSLYMIQEKNLQINIEQEIRAKRDLLLIEDFASGKTEAFDKLIKYYENTVACLLQKLHVKEDDIEDIKQEIFLKVYRNIMKFRNQSSFYTWIYRITINTFFDYNKKNQRANMRLKRIQDNFIEEKKLHINDDSDPFYTTYELITTETLKKAINTLPEIYRSVAIMREINGLSYEEISILVGTSNGGVRSRLMRARVQLRNILYKKIYKTAA